MSENRRKAIAYLHLVLALERHKLWDTDEAILKKAIDILEGK